MGAVGVVDGLPGRRVQSAHTATLGPDKDPSNRQIVSGRGNGPTLCQLGCGPDAGRVIAESESGGDPRVCAASDSAISRGYFPRSRLLISIVCVRPGPTPIAEIGAPDISSRALTYNCALRGRSSKVLAPVMSSVQPGKFW
jgi:hypothetical protein